MTQKTETPAAPQNNTVEKPETEKKPMTPAASSTSPRETFKVVHSTGNTNGNGNGANGTADPFDELQKSRHRNQERGEDACRQHGRLQRKIAETQRAVKQREKDFRNTREILDKLKNASGF